MDISDAVKKAQKGKHGRIQAFEYIIEEFQSRIFTVCYRMTGDVEDAKDISQDTFTYAYVNLKKLKEPEKFSPWIYKIAVNKSLNLINKKKRRILLFYNIHQFEPNKKINISYKKDEVDFLLSKLPLDHRTIFILFYIEELPIKEIASILDITESAVKMRLRRGKEKLKKYEKDINV